MVSAADRQTLAAKNGKPRDANRIAGRTAAMDARDYGGRATANDGSQIERVGNTVYRYVPEYDHTIIERDGVTSAPRKGNHLPGGSIDGMIDQVLEMSGMTQPRNVPVPQSRPSNDSGMTGTENNPGKLADDYVGGEPTETADVEEPEGGWSMGDLLLGALGIGGATVAARQLLKRYQNGERGTVNSDGTATISRVSPDGEPDDITAVADTDEQRQALADPKTKRLPAPPQQIEGPRNALPNTDANLPSAPSPIDETIASTLSDEEFDQRFIADTKQITDADSPYTTRPGNYAPSNAPQVNDAVVQQARQAMDNGDIRTAFRLLNEAGIDIDPNLMRMFAEQSNTAKSLRQRAVDMGAAAATDAARRTAR